MAFLEQGEPLQFGIGLGEREHGRIAAGDRFNLRVRKFLAAMSSDLLAALSPVMTWPSSLNPLGRTDRNRFSSSRRSLPHSQPQSDPKRRPGVVG